MKTFLQCFGVLVFVVVIAAGCFWAVTSIRGCSARLQAEKDAFLSYQPCIVLEKRMTPYTMYVKCGQVLMPMTSYRYEVFVRNAQNETRTISTDKEHFYSVTVGDVWK